MLEHVRLQSLALFLLAEDRNSAMHCGAASMQLVSVRPEEFSLLLST